MKGCTFEKTVLRLYESNPTMSYNDMAKILNCSKPTIQYYFRKNHIIRDRKEQHRLNNTDRNKEVTVSEKAKQILVGTILGDATISKYRRDCKPQQILNSRISATHSTLQKEYVGYLYHLLTTEGLKCNYKESTQVQTSYLKGRKIEVQGYSQVAVTRNIIFNQWRDLWYPKGVKIVPKEFVSSYLTPLAIAVWFMDDGSKNNCSYYLHTEGFTIEDVNFLRELLLNKYNIKTALHKMRRKPTIYISGHSREDFTALILPYICDSMKYKLWIK